MTDGFPVIDPDTSAPDFFPVYIEIPEPDPLSPGNRYPLLNTAEAAVPDCHIRDIYRAVKPDYINPVPALLRCDILKSHISDIRREIPPAVFLRLVHKVDLQHGFFALPDPDIADIDILYNSAAAIRSLDPDHPQEFRAVHLAILNKEIRKTTGYLASDNHSAVTVSHPAVPDYNVP